MLHKHINRCREVHVCRRDFHIGTPHVLEKRTVWDMAQTQGRGVGNNSSAQGGGPNPIPFCSCSLGWLPKLPTPNGALWAEAQLTLF